MKAFVRVLFILILLNSGECFSQELVWQKRYGTNTTDFVRDVANSQNDSRVLGCWGTSLANGDKTVVGYGSTDFWIIKVDSLGNILWQKDYGGSDVEKLEKVSISNDGSIFCGGSSFSPISGTKSGVNYGGIDMWVIKLDSLGNLLWDVSLGGLWDEELYAITATTDGGCVCGGYSQSGISGNKTQNVFGLFDGWVVKLSQNGIIEWQIDLGTTSWDYLFDLIELPDKTILCGLTGGGGASGNKTLTGNGGPDFWIVKLDSTGSIIDQYVYGGTGSDELHEMILTSDNGLICGGLSNSPVSFDRTTPSYGSYDAWIIKLDSNFNVVWDQSIGGASIDNLGSLDMTQNGDVICGIYSDSPITGNKHEMSYGARDFWVVRLDSDGEIIWQNVIGGDQNDELHSVRVTKNGNIFCAGTSWSSVSGDVLIPVKGMADLWLIEINGVDASRINGSVFFDINSNNSRDSSEVLVQNQKIRMSKDNRISFTNSNGIYNFYLVPPDSCSFFPYVNSTFFNLSPAIHNASFYIPNQVDSFNDFAISSAGNFDDLCMTITPLGAFRPGFNGSYMLNYENVGTTTQSPTIVFRIFPNISFVSSSITPSAVYPDSVVWNLSSLSPFQTGQILVTVNLSSTIPIGTILNSYAQIFPIANDVNPSCNNATWEVTVTGSFDPNDISVDQDTLYSNVFPNPPFLDYLIRFQNTGTDTAFTVKILNPLDTMKLDLNSLEFIAASHPMEMRFIYHERNMEFLFNNILLPDSNVNEPASHGFVRYKIKPKSNLQVGDSITNFAAIYFDFNEPVITNTAKTDILLFTGLADQISTSELFVYPNPSSKEINIQISNTQGKRISLDVYNLFGQKVKSLFDGKIMSSELKKQFDISSLNQGVYLLQYNVDGVTKSKKIIKW
ncbi:MAG: T9SS type A sorting domain-containing protein [Bacteroidia bacterium]